MSAESQGARPVTTPVLVLASASPRRQELLRLLGLAFVVRPPQVDESWRPGEPPEDYVLRLARAKAATAGAGELALGADTTVLLDGELLGKPIDERDARRMLRRIAGREHTVLTAVALRAAENGGEAHAVERARVRMAPMSDAEIDWYVATGEPHDKAGAYAAQGLGALFVERIAGNYGTVVGLPLPTTYRLFAALGHDLRSFAGR